MTEAIEKTECNESPIETKIKTLKKLQKLTKRACKYLKDDLLDDKRRLAKRFKDLPDRYVETEKAASEFASLMEIGVITDLPQLNDLIYGTRLDFESAEDLKCIVKRFGQIEVEKPWNNQPRYELVNTDAPPAEGDKEMVWVYGLIPGFKHITVRWKTELPSDCPCQPQTQTNQNTYRSLVCNRQD